MWKRSLAWLAIGGMAMVVAFTLLSGAAPRAALAAQEPKDPKGKKETPKDPKELPKEAPAPGVNINPSRVVAVTVYPQNALVTREVDVPAGQGRLELVVTPLPPATVNSSLYSEGHRRRPRPDHALPHPAGPAKTPARKSASCRTS